MFTPFFFHFLISIFLSTSALASQLWLLFMVWCYYGSSEIFLTTMLLSCVSIDVLEIISCNGIETSYLNIFNKYYILESLSIYIYICMCVCVCVCVCVYYIG